MKYFLHDSNSFNDEKITKLFIEYGYEGLGLFYTLLEKIAQQEKPVNTDVLKAQLKVGKKLEKCWSFMERIELIHSNNGDTFNKHLLNFSEKYKIKSEKNKKRISDWREKQLVTENVTRSENVRNTDKVKLSKVKESKEIEFPFKSETFRSEWFMWKEYKKAEHKFTYKSSISENAALAGLFEMSSGNESKAIQIIKHTIANTWRGFVVPKENVTLFQQQPTGNTPNPVFKDQYKND